jgi:glycosyltransferase involved in cell wall biosynthesis
LGQLERSEINKVFKKSHAFVLPSHSETFGVCYIEALYAGLPVIATRCGGPESFIDKSNGILIPVNNSVELSNAMNSIRYNYSQYDPKQISSDCNKRFSPSVIANELINLYLSLQSNYQ